MPKFRHELAIAEKIQANVVVPVDRLEPQKHVFFIKRVEESKESLPGPISEISSDLIKKTLNPSVAS